MTKNTTTPEALANQTGSPLDLLREIVEDLPGANRGEILRQFRYEIDQKPALFEQIAADVFNRLYSEIVPGSHKPVGGNARDLADAINGSMRMFGLVKDASGTWVKRQTREIM
ncbi:hypothetical protein [Mesorhizobium marinum]|uniref:hypothetical protein n=1 Tax=Mesorhizobium marinum TaxID=3228790 RepID=UPI003465ECE4